MPARVGVGPQPANIEHLSAGDGERLRAIRLRALRDAPQAFGTTWEEAVAQPPESWDRQLEQLATFVATANGCDLGLVRGAPHVQFRDAGWLISMWVAPEARRQGIGSVLVDAVVHWARVQGLDRVLLDVGGGARPRSLSMLARASFLTAKSARCHRPGITFAKCRWSGGSDVSGLEPLRLWGKPYDTALQPPRATKPFGKRNRRGLARAADCQRSAGGEDRD